MSSNSVCNHTRDETNRTPATRSSDFVNHWYDYRPNWTPLSPVTITYSRKLTNFKVLHYSSKQNIFYQKKFSDIELRVRNYRIDSRENKFILALGNIVWYFCISKCWISHKEMDTDISKPEGFQNKLLGYLAEKNSINA